jgi:hypothetical protein
VPFVSQVRIEYGPAVTLVELSSEGAHIETTHYGLPPRSIIMLEMTGQNGRQTIPAKVMRCHLARLGPQPVYSVTLAFAHPLDLADLGGDSVESPAIAPNPALESERLAHLLRRLVFEPSGRLTSEDVLAPAVYDALRTALVTLDSPSGQRAGLMLATPLAALFKATTDRLSTGPTASALVTAIEDHLRHAVPSLRMKDAEYFVHRPDAETVAFTIPSLNDATPVHRLPVAFANCDEPLEWHFQLLKAGVQLIAIARELGRLNGDEDPLATGEDLMDAVALRAS